MPPPSAEARAIGCLLGGAVGDALGAAVEFDDLARIRSRFGPAGIRDYAPCYGRLGALTDDTQMALFTAEGLLRADERFRGRGICHPPSVVHHAYLRWLRTQGHRSVHPLFPTDPDGWLSTHRDLWNVRAPGNTCLSALEGPRCGTVAEPVNDSKGCGTVMRIAPVGIAARDPFALGVEISAITHGHPSGYLAGGALALIISLIMDGADLVVAAREAIRTVDANPRAGEVSAAIAGALTLAREGAPCAEKIESLGGGWVAEEALAIGLYCALVADDFDQGVRLAVNHSGDSDSTGALTGNILGALNGKATIAQSWLDDLELRDVVEEVGRDLAQLRAGRVDERMSSRYPGW